MYLQQKKIEDCDGLEQYIKDCLKNKMVKFIPSRIAICIKDIDLDKEDEGEDDE